MEVTTPTAEQVNPTPSGTVANPNGTKNNLSITPKQSEAEIIKIVGIVIVILIFLVILNYFNILSLSGLFPNQLGWLPRQTNSNMSPQAPNSSQQTNPFHSGKFETTPDNPVIPDLP